jgi:hypothetical protein
MRKVVLKAVYAGMVIASIALVAASNIKWG